MSTKPGEATTQDIIDFLNGDAVLELPDDMMVPPDLVEDKKPTAATVEDDIDGEELDDGEPLQAFFVARRVMACVCVCVCVTINKLRNCFFARRVMACVCVMIEKSLSIFCRGTC